MRRTALIIALLSAGSAVADTLADGKAIYEQTCIACHGSKGRSSIPGVVHLAQKDGPLSKSDEELFNSIKDGRTGGAMTMPPKGGNPNLTDEDLRAVLEYLRHKFQR